MIAFEVSVNGTFVCTAGIENFGVVSAIVTRVRRRAGRDRDAETVEEALMCEVGGLDSTDPAARTHLKWFAQELRVGDSVLIRIVDAQNVSPPAERRVDEANM